MPNESRHSIEETSDARPSLRGIRDLYQNGVNIMGYFREVARTSQNSPESILISYDLQSGSEDRVAPNTEHVARFDAYTTAIARALSGRANGSMLEAGVGEAKTLHAVMAKMTPKPRNVYGFDVAWSRVATGRKKAAMRDGELPRLSTGDFFAMPFADNSFEIVFTAQAVQPNQGREEEALRELYRVTRRWLILIELDYELGNESTKDRIEEHGYCRDLAGTARRLGYHVAEHRLLGADMRPSIQVGLLVIEKPCDEKEAISPSYACPRCRALLTFRRNNYFCTECLTVFPEVDGIPCLLPCNGILATKYLEMDA